MVQQILCSLLVRYQANVYLCFAVVMLVLALINAAADSRCEE